MTKRPNAILFILIWCVLGGLYSAGLGNMITGLTSLPFLGGIADIGLASTLGWPPGTISALGYLLLIGGIAFVVIAYLINQRDPRGRQWGSAVAVVLGLAKLVPMILLAMGTGFFGGPMTGILLAGALDLVVGFLLMRNLEVQDWFGGSGLATIEPDWEKERMRRELDEIKAENARLRPLIQRPGGPPTEEIRLAAPLGWLVNRSKGTQVRPTPLFERNKVGRNPDCNVQLHSPASSREHAVITYEQSRYYITDISKAGTRVNGQRITAKRQLFQNDEIRMGDDVYVFMQVPPERR